MNNNMNEKNNQGINNTFSNNGMNTFANNMNQPNNQTFMNNGFNNQNNQMTESISSNNVGGQFNNNASNPATSEFLYNNSAVTNNMNQPNNQTFMNNNFNNQNPKNEKKNLKLLIGIGILVIISGILVVNLINNKDKNTNIPTNNNSSDITNNNSNDNTDDDSLEYVPLNTYANIAKNVDMKVDSIYVEDKFNFAIKTTLKNNGNKDEIIGSGSMNVDVVAYFQAYFVPKNVSVDNYSEEDIILLPCHLRKMVRNNGEEIVATSEDLILYAGETAEGLIYCPVNSSYGYAAGVNSLILEVQDISESPITSKYFDIRN